MNPMAMGTLGIRFGKEAGSPYHTRFAQAVKELSKQHKATMALAARRSATFRAASSAILWAACGEETK